MADNGIVPNPQFLAPPAVTALRQEARTLEPASPAMARSFSEDMREQRQQLKEAAEQTLNVIVDLDLDGRIKWVSPSWKQVVGTSPESIEGRMISDILVDNKTVFQDAIELMKTDDSRSRFIRFAVPMGTNSVLKFSPEPRPPPSPEGETEDEHQVAGDVIEARPVPEKEEHDHDVLNMEAQGIMVYDRFAPDKAGHTMWMLRPFTQAREVTIDLPPLLVESLGVGAEVLANYLTELADAAGNEPDPSKHPVPTPVLCRICERQILPWWFEKHSDLCLQEHRAEMDVQIAQENLNEHRHVIVRVLDALEARQGRSLGGDTGIFVSPQPEYKGLPIGPSPTASGPSSGIASSSSSSPGTPSRSREQSVSGAGHARARSFAVRRPLARIVELVLDLCDTALEISTPALKESRTDIGEEFRTLSPQSESRITQVLQWQSPSSNTLEQEQGLAALAADTEEVAKAKVDAVVRHRKIVEYAERIRIEYTVLVEECIAAALSKAERIAAGQLSDSSCSSAEDEEEEEEADEVADSSSVTRIPSREPSVASSISALTASMRESTDRLMSRSEGRSSSVAVSTGSNSPMECPTPRSHKSAAGLLSTSQPSRRGTLLADLDAGETSDSSSVPSSILPGAIRTDSPSSERSLERKRRSLVLPGLCGSPRRQQSPARIPPHSPLRMPKPRLSSGAESMPSPIASPSTSMSEFALHHFRHHRRQSSASDVPRPPVSPRLTSVSQPQPRPAPPSIKDFEIIKPISKGAFGSVYLSKKKSTGEYFAIKVLKKADMIAKNQVTNVKAERAIMMWQGESDFVAKLYWTFSSKEYLYLVMEYLNGGDCASLVKILGGLSEDWAKKYVAEVVLGVEHLHSRGIVHRDLKPDNLLIDQSGHLKLTDFGLSRMGLVGRQKRVLKSPNEPVPDLLRQGPFPRARSLASSRSASFDLQGSYSPGSTPLITPDVAGAVSQPSYFSLNQSALSRQSSRRASGYRSDSGGSDTLNAIFRTFSLNEGSETPAPLPLATSAAEEEGQSELSDSPHLQPIQQASSSYPTASVLSQLGTPPQQSMMPPLMALFDPEDHNRRFVGTPDYLAPETINGVGQDEMSDWWSLGCIMFEFLFGYPPFNAATPDEVFDNILHRRINWPDEPEALVSHEALDLMNKLMTIHPRERLGANLNERFPNGGAEIRAHTWFYDINWDTLLEDKAEFVPNVENPEDTEYFDNRGATLQTFTEELEDQISPPHPVTTGPYPDRPHDALFKVRSQVNAIKRPLMPLHIPPHVRDSRSRRLSEPVLTDDFGSFTFKNLPMLEKANKDVIQKLRQEALQAQQRQNTSSVAQTPVSTSSPSLDGSPLPMPLQRTMSQTKGSNRPSSPSAFSQANSSPSRPSQPSSPLLVQFSTGQNHERRKTSGSSSTNSHQLNGSFQPAATDQGGRVTNLKLASAAASPGKAGGRITTHSPEKTASGQPKVTLPPARARSQTIGSQDGDATSLAKEPYASGHHKRRSQLFDISPSSSDNEDPRTKALLKIQRRRQSSRRLSQINMLEGPFFRPLDVLICEDHPVSRLVMDRLFEKLRCRTITAVNGAEAMRYALSEIQFDIIMTEFRLPQVNGADFARMVREARSANRHTPIVAVTGYLKDLPETHHFDALIEKPPTLTKLTEALCKFCQWKPPPKDYSPSQRPPPLTAPASAPRNVPGGYTEDSPSSASSGFAHLPASSYRGSSRADSIASSYFGDMDQIKPEDVPFIISRQNDEWTGNQGGLGISEDPAAAAAVAGGGSGGGQPVNNEPPKDANSGSGSVPFPNLLHAASAPAAMDATGALTPRKQRSSEAIRAKRESLEKKRYECAESGDDEDDELGNVHIRTRSPTTRTQRPGSKLGIEMMRTNSRGSVVSGSEEILKKEAAAAAAAGMEKGGGSAADVEEALVSPSGTGLEDKFDLLRIPEDAVAESSREVDISPRHSLSPLPEDYGSGSDSLPTTTELRRPSLSSLSQYETEIYTGPLAPGSGVATSAGAGAGTGFHNPRPRSELQSKGQTTPPIVLTRDDGGLDDASASASASEPHPKTPHHVLSLGVGWGSGSGSDSTARSDGDVSPTPDSSEATPRPMHTPSPSHNDPEETPRAQPSRRPAAAKR